LREVETRICYHVALCYDAHALRSKLAIKKHARQVQ
jgi:hypothetical protein